MYDKLLEIYKFNQEERIKKEKFVLRSKKKTISYLNVQSNKRRIKYLWNEFLKDQIDAEDRRKQESRALMSFDDIYQSKVDMEQEEKAK